MKWSWKLVTFAGIPIHVHATFLLLLGWVALAHWSREPSLRSVVAGLGFVLALFACVLLHELGHALTARRYGIGTRDITLLPIGGLARLERMPEDPRQELSVALAGPAVNAAIAALLFVWLWLTAGMEPIATLEVTSGPFVERLMMVNVSLALFNLLPAFPMDGGRVLRALLAMRMEHGDATRIAASLGQGMALLLGFLGLFMNPFLLFIALFVWIGAAEEGSASRVTRALAGLPVRRVMLTDTHQLSPGDPLQRAIDLTLAGSQQDFPVTDEGRVVGLLTRGDLLRGLSHGGARMLVANAMRREFESVETSDLLETVVPRAQLAGWQTAPVMDTGRLVGLLTLENVAEFLMIQGAISAASPDSNAPVRTAAELRTAPPIRFG